MTVQGTGFGFGTFALGAPSSNGGGGLQFTWAIIRHLRIYGEWTYLAGGTDNFNVNYILAEMKPTTRQVTLSAKTSFQNVLGGLQWLFLIRRYPKFVPYAETGVGLIPYSGGASGSSIGSAPGQSFSGSIHGHGFVWSGGVGTRYYFTERAGVRFEVKGLFGPQSHVAGPSALGVALTSGRPRVGRFDYAVFYQFH